jgi:hypothetical protein
LTNPSGAACVNGACTGKLNWLGGLEYVYKHDDLINVNVTSTGRMIRVDRRQDKEMLATDRKTNSGHACVTQCLGKYYRRSGASLIHSLHRLHRLKEYTRKIKIKKPVEYRQILS